MGCNSVVYVSYVLTSRSTIQVLPFIPLIAGIENGKPYYTWVDVSTGLDFRIYWSAINTRWEMKYFPSGTIFAFLNTPELECPGLIGTNGWTIIQPIIGEFITISDLNTILESPIIPIDDDTSCCINVQFTDDEENVITLNGIKALPLTFPAGYMLDFDSLYPGFILLLSIVDGFWQMADMSNPADVYFTSTISSDCPESISADSWTNIKIFPYLNFIIYRIECEIENDDVPADIEPIDCNVPCVNSNLLKKQKSALSKDIADISKREVFGLKCSDNWENIFMRSLIIDALSCIPYGVYSKDTEACLISKLIDKCNC